MKNERTNQYAVCEIIIYHDLILKTMTYQVVLILSAFVY